MWQFGKAVGIKMSVSDSVCTASGVAMNIQSVVREGDETVVFFYVYAEYGGVFSIC